MPGLVDELPRGAAGPDTNRRTSTSSESNRLLWRMWPASASESAAKVTPATCARRSRCAPSASSASSPQVRAEPARVRLRMATLSSRYSAGPRRLEVPAHVAQIRTHLAELAAVLALFAVDPIELCLRGREASTHVDPQARDVGAHLCAPWCAALRAPGGAPQCPPASPQSPLASQWGPAGRPEHLPRRGHRVVVISPQLGNGVDERGCRGRDHLDAANRLASLRSGRFLRRDRFPHLGRQLEELVAEQHRSQLGADGWIRLNEANQVHRVLRVHVFQATRAAHAPPSRRAGSVRRQGRQTTGALTVKAPGAVAAPCGSA